MSNDPSVNNDTLTADGTYSLESHFTRITLLCFQYGSEDWTQDYV